MARNAFSNAWTTWGLGFALPVGLIAVILIADVIESPKTAYVGVLAVVPMLAAVFATPAVTALVAVITWLSGWGFGLLAADGNVPAQTVRLIIIAMFGLAAVGASTVRVRRERALTSAQIAAAKAAELKVQAHSDELTGLSNRFGLVTALESIRSDRTRCVALLDCDRLKEVNDRFGHLAGDDYLRAVAGRISHGVPGSDLVARWGGDEFILIQDRPAAAAAASLDRVRTAISSEAIRIGANSIEGSISVGLADWPAGQDFDAALSAADAALYQAKSQGRDQIVLAPSTPPTMPE
jgi:diguanylate cyclase (GGDEF)-like protein